MATSSTLPVLLGRLELISWSFHFSISFGPENRKKTFYDGEGLKTFIYRNGSSADTDLKVDYCASKFACVGLDEALRVELAVQV